VSTLFIIIVAVFVIAVLALVGYGFFEMSPFARHSDQLRDPTTGERRWESPHLD